MKTTGTVLLTILCLIMVLSGALFAQEKYIASVDLVTVENDRLAVKIKVPSIAQRKALFVFPKVVPGTYDNSSFGRYVEDFKVFDRNGKKLKSRKIDVNAYRMKRSNKVDHVRYLINDTWDEKTGKYIFQPGGTNFNAGSEFVLNTFGICGYIDGFTAGYPYQLEITKPKEMYGATSLDRLEGSDARDVFIAENYVEMVDQPILYAVPDTISYYEGGARVGIAVYSPVEEIDAQVIKEIVQPLTQATSFVLGNIPTDEYWFLLHFFNWNDPEFFNGGHAFGALEHKKSSLYFVPTFMSEEGVDMESVKSTLHDMATHEFLHILAPLNLHSEEIAYFDFYDTRMSEHLWLYEGVTEYLSMKSLLIGGVKSMEEFLEDVVDKINGAQRYDEDLSFTELSRNVIDPEMQKQYGNVYQKGALLAMMLDIKIAEVTNGEMDLIDLVLDLIDEYGIGKPFRDEELFNVITSKTDQEMRTFFRNYFEGSKELPIEELLSKSGLAYNVEIGDANYSFGPLQMEFDAREGILTITPEEGNEILTSRLAISGLNGESLSFRLVRSLLTRPDTGDPLTIEHVVDGDKQEIVVTPKIAEGDLDYSIDTKENKTAMETLLFNKLYTPHNRK